MAEQDIKTIILRINGDEAKQELDAIRDKIAQQNKLRDEAQQDIDRINHQLQEQRELKEQLQKRTLGNNLTEQQRVDTLKQIIQAQERINRLEERKKIATDDYAKAAREAAKAEKKAATFERRTQAVVTALERMDAATPKQLQETIRKLTADINSGKIARGSEEWEAYTAAVRQAKTQLREVQEEMAAAPKKQGFVSSLLDGMNRLQGSIVTAYAAVEAYDQLKQYVTQLTKDFAEYAEHLAGVTKYTGLSADAVRELNEEFKRMDTRTPIEQLNDLAADAGRLGIQSKEEVLAFVDAANQINVALGEDLGEDAVKNIGKLTQLFGIEQQRGLKEGMLATASTINELAQTSSAAEPYIMDFTARLAAVGHSAGISQPQIMALASVLDEGMVSAEKAATAMQNVLTQLFKKPAEMAAAAKLPVQEFQELLKRDANEALLTFLQAIHDAGDLDKIAPMLGDMTLEGSGATQMLSSLARDIEKVRTVQQQATTAFEQGTSATREYNIANNTTQAQMEKAQERFKLVRIELGERLLPVAGMLVSSGAGMAKLLLALIKLFTQHTGTVVALATTWTLYALAVNRATIATKLNAAWAATANAATKLWAATTATYRIVVESLTLAYHRLRGSQELAAAAQARLNAAMATNHIGLVVALVATLVTVVGYFVGKASEATQQQQALNKALADGTTQADNEGKKIDQLYQRLNKAKEGTKEYKAAKDAILKQYGGYLSRLKDENGKVLDVAKAYTKLKEEAMKAARARAMQAYIDTQGEKLIKDQAKSREKLLEHMKQRYGETMKAADGATPMYVRMAELAEQGRLNNKNFEQEVVMTTADGMHPQVLKRNDVADLVAGIKYLDKQMKDMDEHAHRIFNIEEGYTPPTAAETPTIDIGNNGEGATTTSGSTTDMAKTEAERAKLMAQYAEIEKAAEKHQQEAFAQYTAGLIDAEQFHQAQLTIERKALEQKRDIHQQGTQDYAKAQADIDALDQQHAKRRKDWDIRALEAEEKERLHQLDVDQQRGNISEREAQEARNAIVLEFLDRRKRLYEQYGQNEDYEKAQLAIDDELHRQRLEKERGFAQQVAQLRNEYLRKSASERMQIELDTLDRLLQAEAITAEEAERIRAQIRQKYEGRGGSMSARPTTRRAEHSTLQNPKQRGGSLPAGARPTAQALPRWRGLSLPFSSTNSGMTTSRSSESRTSSTKKTTTTQRRSSTSSDLRSSPTQRRRLMVWWAE